ncbi:MAG: hypothetical protein IJT60_06905 [Clostridia bacterium]|nr:hypothetical protein [Clostridia bacterium]
MIIFQQVFEDKYQFFLKDIEYTAITVGPISEKTDVVLKDDFNYNLSYETNSFNFEVKRTVSFSPNALYRLSVTFGAKLIIRDTAAKLNNVNWDEEFRNNPVCINLIQGLLSRISVLISQITSSYGQNPLVTPPSLVN